MSDNNLSLVSDILIYLLSFLGGKISDNFSASNQLANFEVQVTKAVCEVIYKIRWLIQPTWM